MTRTLGASPLRMTEEQRDELERIIHSFSSPYHAVAQATALLLAADGATNCEVARRLGVASHSVRTWRRRFRESGTSWVGATAPRRGRQSSSPAGAVDQVSPAKGEVPDDGATDWSPRALADCFGLGNNAVARIWRVHGREPGTS